MRRLVLLLLLLLPVQWTWAAAASVCRHESSIQAHHIGHHEHRHTPQAGAGAEAGGTDEAAGHGFAHADCASCHAVVPALVTQPSALPPVQRPPLAFTPYRRSVTVGIPERLIRPPHPVVA